MRNIRLLTSAFFLLIATSLYGGQHKFAILIASYNNEAFCENNIRSALSQSYDKFRIIFINDASCDNTLEIVKGIVREEGKEELVTFIDNPTRRLALANYTEAIHKFVKNDEIVVILDGDDELAHRAVLRYLDKIYSEHDVWLTYGQFLAINSCEPGWCHPYPQEVITRNGFRNWQDGPSHLRTFYAWLFKLIDIKDLKLGEQYYMMTGDLAMMLPMVEMARYHMYCVNQTLYLYNDGNPLSDHNISRQLQVLYDKHIRSLPKYEAILHPYNAPCKNSKCRLCNSGVISFD